MSDIAIRFDNVGKMYKVFSSRRANLFEALGIDRLLKPNTQDHHEFWALRGINFELRRGERLGIIGRNGAGKSTLLKLVTGNLPQTEGTVEVNGEVQALLEVGGGLHPEFTGTENIRAALGFLGLTGREVAAAATEIAEFTELGRFLDQPFKTYSLGMQARLSFGIATAIRPEILIIDEILGAGDAYFFTKSTARMVQLMEGGASILLVSHGLDQVVRFCERTIWIDRGRIAMEGPSNEVVKAYERFIRELEDQRLKAKNEKTQRPVYDGFDRESYTDAIVLNVGPACDVSRVVLRRDGRIEDEADVGQAQDSDSRQSAALVANAGAWSTPRESDGLFFRSVAGGPDASGALVFSLWFFYPKSEYDFTITYRSPVEPVTVRLDRAGQSQTTMLPAGPEWQTRVVRLALADEIDDESDRDQALSRWPGVKGLKIDRVRMLDDAGDDQAVFEVHKSLRVAVRIVAEEEGTFPLIPAALVFRLDGIVVTRHVGDRVVLDLDRGDYVEAELNFGPLQLGNGTYLLSVGLYKELEITNTLSSSAYDYFDRSFEFMVTGNPPLHTEVFRHPGEWTLRSPSRTSREQAGAVAEGGP